MNTKDIIVEKLKTEKNGLTSKDLTVRIGVKYKTIRNRVGELIRDGVVAIGEYEYLDHSTDRYNKSYILKPRAI